jgi:CHAD domain-containing protein
MRIRPRPSAAASDEARRLLRAQARVVDTRTHAWLNRTSDRNALHDARVALRRLRVLVRAFRAVLGPLATRRVRRQLREAFKATSELRDLDVFAAWLATLPTSRATRHLEAVAAAEARVRVLEASGLMRSAWRRARRRLLSAEKVVAATGRGATPHFGTAAARALRAEIRVLNAGVARCDPIRAAGDVHQTRIATKRLRYLVEALSEGLSDARRVAEWCRAFQDLAGEWRDARATVVRVRACPPLPGRSVVVERVAVRRRAALNDLRQFVADDGAWQIARRDALAISRRYALGSRPPGTSGVR